MRVGLLHYARAGPSGRVQPANLDECPFPAPDSAKCARGTATAWRREMITGSPGMAAGLLAGLG
jgi:hypothetical protein